MVKGCNSDFAPNMQRRNGSALGAKNRRGRLIALALTITFGFSIVVCRLFSLQIAHFQKWQDWALKQHFSELKIASERGPIIDRNGKTLATSVPSGSIYVRPGQVKDRKAVVAGLTSVLEIEKDLVEKKLDSRSPFVWVTRQIPRMKAEEVVSLDLKGVGYVVEARRFYPYNSAASRLIGRVGIDGNGLSGLELKYEKELHRDQAKATITRDALGKMIVVADSKEEEFETPRGHALQLTLDAPLQTIVEEELEAGRKNANSKSAMAVLVNADSGEILALGQAPGLNLNSDAIQSRAQLNNLIAETVYEPGSILKPIVAAAALEAGVVTPETLIDCEKGAYRVGKHSIEDVHPSETIPFYDVVVRSSNIGMSKVGFLLGRERIYESLKKFGFGSFSGLSLPGESGGILRKVSNWREIDVATHSFGQGVAVTALQVVRAVSAIVNEGKLPTLHLNYGQGEHTSKQIISTETANTVKQMMVSVVEDEHGTGKKAAIPGVIVGGKTGTAQKAREDGPGYAAGKYISSYVGFVDGRSIGVKERLVLIVSIDEPDTTSIYGGVLAAPVFKRIMERSFRLLAKREYLSEPIQRRHKQVEDLLFTRIGYRQG